MFQCNVCIQSFSMESFLNSHLKSSNHQFRMTKLAELVANNEIEPNLPVSQQPNGIPQKSIGELIDSDKLEVKKYVCFLIFKIFFFKFCRIYLKE